MPKALDLTGQRFGRLTVLCRATVPGARNAMWRCQCDCGKTTIGAAANLGKTKSSCGCLASESATATLRVNRLAKPHLHGMSHTTEWRIWSQMKGRCSNPKHHKAHRYSKRGIKVCERWIDSFENFYADMGPRPSKRHSIDRIDNNGDYKSSNCRWAIGRVQARNSNTPHMIKINGIELCVIDWCETLGVPKWRAYELTRNRGRHRDLPPTCKTIDDAIKLLHKQSST